VHPFNSETLQVFAFDLTYRIRREVRGTGRCSVVLAFLRDVVRIAGREQAACFAMDELDARGQTRPLAKGMGLVLRALEDRAE
jgi:hypothetical protein